MCGGKFSPHHYKQNALNVNTEEAANIMKKGEYTQEWEDTDPHSIPSTVHPPQGHIGIAIILDRRGKENKKTGEVERNFSVLKSFLVFSPCDI